MINLDPSSLRHIFQPSHNRAALQNAVLDLEEVRLAGHRLVLNRKLEAVLLAELEPEGDLDVGRDLGGLLEEAELWYLNCYLILRWGVHLYLVRCGVSICLVWLQL